MSITGPAKVNTVVATETPSTAYLTAEITFLLTDVERSTIYWEMYPQEIAAALARHDALIEWAAGEPVRRQSVDHVSM